MSEPKHIDFMAVAGKNPAAELRKYSEEHDNFCCIVPGKSGETLFDAFDVQEWVAPEVEAIVRKYAEMENPGQDDGISYIRKGENPGDPVVEYSNGRTDANVCLSLSAPEFE